MDVTKKILDDKIALAKLVAAPMNAIPLMEYLAKYGPTFTDVQRKKFEDIVDSSTKRVGEVLLDRALSDGTLSDNEWKMFQHNNLMPIDLASVLQAYYTKKDGLTSTDEKLVVVVTNTCPAYKLKEYFLKKFDVIVVNEMTAMEIMQKRCKR